MRLFGRMRETAARFAAFVAVMAGVPVSGRAYAAGDVNHSSCPVTTESSPGFRPSLPDCRAYEIVGASNSDDTANVEGSYGFPEGVHVYYKSFLPTPAAGAGNGLPERFLATRTSSGWVQQPISAPQGEGPSHMSLASQENAEGVLFTKDFSEAFVSSFFRNPFEAPVLNQTTGMGVYKLSLANGTVSMQSLPDSGTLTQGMLENSEYAALANVNDWGSFLIGGSADGSRAFFVTTAKLATATGTTQDTHEASNEIYERAEGHTYLVGILPDGSVPVCGVEIAQSVGSTVATTPLYSYGAIAPDGANVVFNTPGRKPLGEKEPCNEEGLFLRDVVDDKTVQLPGSIFAGRAGTSPGEEEKIFTFGSGALDEYHVGTGQTTEVGDAAALLTYTPDGSHVFYLGHKEEIFVVEEGKLPTEIPKTNEGGYNASIVGARGGGEILGGGPTEYPETNNMPVTTPNGSSLLFIDTAQLTEYDNCPEVEGNKVCHHEAYVYDAKTNKVTCISCNLANVSPQGQAQLIDVFAMDFGEGLYQNPSPPLISNDGSRAVFETTEALVPQDVNGTDDVYEWVREGAEGCTAEGLHVKDLEESEAYSHVIEGCIYMLSSGLGKEVPNENGIIDGTHLVGASENLQDVYMQTSESLLPGLDNASKLYDVRVDGGFPFTQTSRGCEQCAIAGGKPAPLGMSATEVFAGAGNLASGVTHPAKKKSSASMRKRRLVHALKVCRKQKSKHRRVACERRARRRFPASFWLPAMMALLLQCLLWCAKNMRRRSEVRQGRTHEITMGKGGCMRGIAPAGVAGITIAAMLTVWLALATPAFAAWGSPEAVGRGSLSGPLGVAVEESTGDLYVANLLFAGNDKFDLAHNLLSPPSPFGGGLLSGLTLNAANGRVYVVNGISETIQSFDSSTGEQLGEFSIAGSANFGSFTIVQIASDAVGNIYLPNSPNNEVQVFGAEGGAPAGGVVASIKGEGEHKLSAPTGVAVDSAGHVWVADDGNGRLEEFEPSGEFVKEIPVAGVQSVAVDASGDLFASVVEGEGPHEGPHIVEFDSAGNEIEEFGLGTLNNSGVPVANAVAVDSTHQIVYVSDGETHNVVWAFTKRPEVSTSAATSVTTTGATLHGSVNPGGEEPVSSCEFEYAPEAEYKIEHKYGHTIACTQSPAQIGSGNESVQVSAEVTGLETDETYHFRLSASNAVGPAFGGDQTFTAIEPVFDFQLSGPDALEMVVSKSADPSEPAAGNPAELDTQAGSHPFDVTTRFLLNTKSDRNLPANLQPKDYYVDIPAGFAGSVAKIPRCKMSELSSLTNRQRPSGCPTASQVGVIRLFKGPESGALESEPLPVYNMVPPPGVPAEIAFPYILIGEPVTFQLRPGGADGGYGITAKVSNISEVQPIVGSQLTLWGVPADPAHDAERFLPERGSSINIVFTPGDEGKPLPAGTAEVPFLTNPTKCGAQEDATINADSWLHPGQLDENGHPEQGGAGWVTANTPMFPNGITGCNKLTFHPEMEVKPEKTVADSPTGLTVDLRVPQSENPNNLATPSLKEAKVALPQGLAISPSQANGLEGCTEAQIKLHTLAEPECPNASQVGKLELVTPLLPEPLTGQIYLSSEREGNKFHIYLVVEGQGVLVKLKGNVVANEQTGQLTSTFTENPQLPFSELKLTFYGGSRAPLATPNACGSYTTTSFFEPWSHDEANGEPTGTPDAEPAVEPFSITSGCVSGFAPGFKAGMENPVAGAYSPFVLQISREDDEQELSGVQIKMPTGLVGKLAGVEECSDAQIAHAEHNTGTAEKASPSCPASSQIGTVQSGAGPGETPFYVPGKAYLTGPYKGAPYGVVVIVPALAGPFDLGTIVVRAAINIDPHTAQVTVTSDPLPRMLDGIPLKVRQIEVDVNRPNFTLNPTSCNQMTVNGSLESTQNAQHSASARFQVGDCKSLAFKPGFKVSTGARHTKRFGAKLDVKITSGQGQANIKSVLAQLPKALPSRVSTLKGACAEKQYEENPAGCPAASMVGTAVAHTPILSTPLTGPAIFVSHGGAAFPDLDIVLQGSGITVELEGNTNIKHDITTSDFKSAPDVPVSSFELMLPTGPHSALAANGSFCFKTVVKDKHKVKQRVKLIMPTTITGQNGAVVTQNTVIAVQGCPALHKKRK